MSESTSTVNINYKVTGIDDAVKGSQKVLYAVNALRIGINDIERFQKAPTMQNAMWTAIQLSRIYTHLDYLIDKVNAKAVASVALQQTTLTMSLTGALGTATAGVGGYAAMLAGLMAIPGAPIAIGAAAFGGGYYLLDRRNRKIKEDWIEEQDNILRRQGF